MSDLIDYNNDEECQARTWKKKKIRWCVCMVPDVPWLLLFNSVCDINKHLLSSTPTLFSIPVQPPSPLSYHHLFRGDQEQSPALMGLHRGLNWIAGELKKAGWLQQPSITSHLPHFSLLTSPMEYQLSGLHLAAPRWRVFCSPCTPVISPSPPPRLFPERLHSRERP